MIDPVSLLKIVEEAMSSTVHRFVELIEGLLYALQLHVVELE